MRGGALASVIALIAIGGASAGVDLSRRSPHSTRLSHAYQQSVGGLGLGAAQSLGTCPAAYDPRLARSCSAQTGRYPGGGPFCIGHAGLGNLKVSTLRTH